MTRQELLLYINNKDISNDYKAGLLRDFERAQITNKTTLKVVYK